MGITSGHAQTAGKLLLIRPRVLGTKAEMVFDKKERLYPIEYSSATWQGDN